VWKKVRAEIAYNASLFFFYLGIYIYVLYTQILSFCFIRLDITQFHHIILTFQNTTVYYKNNDALAIPQRQMQNNAEWLLQ